MALVAENQSDCSVACVFVSGGIVREGDLSGWWFCVCVCGGGVGGSQYDVGVVLKRASGATEKCSH